MAGESRKARITRMHRQYETLCEFIPTVKCQLDFHTPFELLVATILSAQTTDKRVNSITPELFGTYPTAAALAAADYVTASVDDDGIRRALEHFGVI